VEKGKLGRIELNCMLKFMKKWEKIEIISENFEMVK